jgi:hypothetical protein
MSILNCVSSAELTQLEMKVRARLLGIVHDLRLVAQDSGLVLRGRSHTYYGKQLAQQAIMEAALLPLLANEIEIA